MRIRRKRFRRAQFRDAYFYIESHDFETGRRVSISEFPNRDEPSTEDLGRKARHMNIRAFILGADYLKQRDALISACEEYGPGKLVHPYFGTRTVNCVTCREFETSLEGGIIHFDLSFVETVVTSIPRVQKDTESDLIRSFNDTIRTAGEYYERGIKGIDRAASSIEDTSEALLAVSDQIENQFAHLMRFTDSIDTMRRSVSDFKSTLVYSVSEPTRAWNKLVGLWWKRREREGPKRAVKWGPVAELDGPVI